MRHFAEAERHEPTPAAMPPMPPPLMSAEYDAPMSASADERRRADAAADAELPPMRCY